jgi:uncharacterized repeat protein (TIGR03803 family)
MRGKKFFYGLSAVLAVFALTTFITATRMAAQTESVLHTFNDKDGREPLAGLIVDASGNLYGTTLMGGVYNCGGVFELIPKSGGGWTERMLHSFNNNGKDGYSPLAGVIADASGNLYGTTSQGGPNNGGVVFELSPKAGGGWSEKLLHGFSNSNTMLGSFPSAGLIFDAVGNLYGTLRYGGTHASGAVFELMPNGSGGWSEKLLHSFNNLSADGIQPEAGLIFDSAGNLYGTTSTGGAGASGTVFELKPGAGGTWTETVLHSFGSGQDGYTSLAGLIIDAAGNLYGTTELGGTAGFGIVFELTPGPGGTWTENVLHNFTNNTTDGGYSSVGLVSDSAGNVYGVTQKGGSLGLGVVFKLTATGGSWTETIVHNFGSARDGQSPQGTLIFDALGNLYGTTYDGGASWGTVFEITP